MPDNTPGTVTVEVVPAKASDTAESNAPVLNLSLKYLVPDNPTAFPFPLVFLSAVIVDPETKTFLFKFKVLLARLSASAISSSLFPPSIPSNRS